MFKAAEALENSILTLVGLCKFAYSFIQLFISKHSYVNTVY